MPHDHDIQEVERMYLATSKPERRKWYGAVGVTAVAFIAAVLLLVLGGK
jgi:hypothetical protein